MNEAPREGDEVWTDKGRGRIISVARAFTVREHSLYLVRFVGQTPDEWMRRDEFDTEER